jgi:hypothetical protein
MSYINIYESIKFICDYILLKIYIWGLIDRIEYKIYERDNKYWFYIIYKKS